MRRGELSPVMYLVLAMLVLIAVLVVVFSLRDRSFGILDTIAGMFR